MTTTMMMVPTTNNDEGGGDACLPTCLSAPWLCSNVVLFLPAMMILLLQSTRERESNNKKCLTFISAQLK